MVTYFKKYIAYIVLIAFAAPTLACLVYASITGQVMLEPLWGKIVAVVLLIVALVLAFMGFEKKTEAKSAGWIRLYNQQCEPEALINRGRDLAANISFPCNEEGAWFMGYYAQALLDVGEVAQARRIEQGLRLSIEQAKKPLQKVRILVNLIQIVEKTGTLEDSLELVDKGLQILGDEKGSAAEQRRNFLISQRKIVLARMSENQHTIIEVDEAVKRSEHYPRRVRVEYAFDEALSYDAVGDLRRERENLIFVMENGNQMSIVKQAIRQFEKIAKEECMNSVSN